MKKYELVQLNKGVSMTRGQDIEKAQEAIDKKTEEGWELMQIVSPADLGGAMIGVFVKEI